MMTTPQAATLRNPSSNRNYLQIACVSCAKSFHSILMAYRACYTRPIRLFDNKSAFLYMYEANSVLSTEGEKL